MAQTGTHSFVAAHIVRVGDTTALIALPDWHHGQILVPVDTMLLMQVTL
ncbi:hypothetical protein JK359_33265 [Streptomyces actinomycinicus]|uniref:Uncharacterized protein n=1 Tax=Streptomyces actinomycinicus TaxID=1695166 RepID=A0A937ENV3_9ACTN|nr:hypothetical protein [Streptomyces actinomycinicus]MBL1086778.1 hypothetical protein [Streptomyces actinomycinicus]